MRASQAEKERSHKRIVEGASRLIREQGIEATSVSDVMTDAGLTNGGFYKHFESKDALVVDAVRAAFDEMTAFLEMRLGQEGALAAYCGHYLSEGHVASPGIGCPVAALSGDVARAPPALKAEFGAGVRRTLSILAAAMTGSDEDNQRAAARKFAMMAGAVLIARASDRETAKAVLAAVSAP